MMMMMMRKYLVNRRKLEFVPSIRRIVMSCENNRGIALLCTAYKVLMNMPQIRAIHGKCNWGISGQLQNG